MGKATEYQNPGSKEIRSPFLAGITEALNKISGILSLTTAQLQDYALSVVAIDSKPQNLNRIYSAEFGKRLWLKNPPVVVKKNGTVITPSSDGFDIDYIGGSIAFDVPLNERDIITVSATYISSASETLNNISNALQESLQNSERYKGIFETLDSLQSAVSKPQKDNFAFVSSPTPATYIYNGSDWIEAGSDIDLSDYVQQTDFAEKLNGKEPSISAHGAGNEDLWWYYTGKKTWQDLRATVLTIQASGIDDNVSDTTISATDELIKVLSKLATQTKKNSQKEFISGNGAPLTNTKGTLGQRYVNTSNGDWYVCTNVLGSTYTWKKGASADDLNTVKTQLNQKAEKSQGKSVVLDVQDWQATGNLFTATKDVSGVTADNNIIATAAPQNVDVWSANMIYCSAQAEGKLTFSAKKKPVVQVTANILIMG